MLTYIKGRGYAYPGTGSVGDFIITEGGHYEVVSIEGFEDGFGNFKHAHLILKEAPLYLSDSEIKAMREEFEKYVGYTPEAWLKRHRAGEREGVFDNSSKNLWIHFRALFLEEIE